MKLPDLENKLTRTVWMRKNGTLKVVQVPVNKTKTLEPKPMFPIERPDHGSE